ncbi:MAG: hypothetical protein Q8O59_00925 [bacterium]|nr:hypothetical protein [bacterium]
MNVEHNNIILENKESAQPHRALLNKEKKLGFAGEVEIAKKNIKNSLEIRRYREKANLLLLEHSAQELLEIGENNREELDLLCGEDNDSSVIIAICFYLEDQVMPGRNN